MNQTYSEEFSSEEPRPWVRFWARSLDMILLSYPSAYLSGLLFPEFIASIDTRHGGNIVIQAILIFPLMVVIEAFMLSILGNTPAKAILKTKITNAKGKDLSFSEAIKRGFYIYFSGYGLGIPIVFFFTYLWQYHKLKKQGKTEWDKNLKFNVSHSHIGGVRIAIFVALLSVGLCLELLLFVATLLNKSNI